MGRANNKITIWFLTQSDFYMIGRCINGQFPRTWNSKKDKRERVVDIMDPEASLHSAYPDTKLDNRTMKKLCFCCDRAKMKME